MPGRQLLTLYRAKTFQERLAYLSMAAADARPWE
jgi:hypothetical protein